MSKLYSSGLFSPLCQKYRIEDCSVSKNCPVSRFVKGYRQVLIVRQGSMIYSVSENNIFITALIDNGQSRKRIKIQLHALK